MAVAFTSWADDELVGYVTPPPTGAPRRRRVASHAVLALLVASLAWGATRAAAALGSDPASAPEHRPSSSRTYVVQPGDTLWSIARQLQPEGDIRPLVHRLLDAHGTAELQVGDRLVVPAPSRSGPGGG